jgi:hypothetical protein
MFKPSVPARVEEIYVFVNKNSNHTTEKSGMTGITTGINRYELYSLADRFNIPLECYDYFIDEYESKLLEQQKKIFDKEK